MVMFTHNKTVYSWYNTEDGQDCPKKFKYLVERAFMYGSVAYPGVCAFKQPDTFAKFGMVYAGTVLPLMGMAGFFSVTTCLLCREFPKMNPKWAYIAGSFAAGSVYGAFTNSPKAGGFCGFYLSIVAVACRTFYEENWTLIPDIQLNPEGAVWSGQIDTSLVEEPVRPPPAAAVLPLY